MSQTIYKYGIGRPIGYTTTLTMPENATILKADIQIGGYDIQIWAMVDPHNANTTTRTFIAYPTGGIISYDVEQLQYLNTVTEIDAGLVWHVFEVFP